jgi:AAA+ superfamily predicted ATPase
VGVTKDELFEQVLEFPDPAAQERFGALVGIDDIKERVVAEASLLLDSEILLRWSEKHHGAMIRAAIEVTQRTPLLVFAGDVGTGKTELAESFCDAVARTMNVDITLYPLSLSARGKGAVGEMTSLLTGAFSVVREAASKGRDGQGRIRHGVVLLVDEGDALAQSRDLAQMHHEDRAGVNALIRGIDQLRSDQLAVLTVLCTNRLDALDSALLRRAAHVFRFARPEEAQRRVLLTQLLQGSDISSGDIDKLVALTGGHADMAYGCTYSDLRQRLVPEAVLDAIARDARLIGERMIELARDFEPTKPFGGES